MPVVGRALGHHESQLESETVRRIWSEMKAAAFCNQQSPLNRMGLMRGNRPNLCKLRDSPYVRRGLRIAIGAKVTVERIMQGRRDQSS